MKIFLGYGLLLGLVGRRPGHRPGADHHDLHQRDREAPGASSPARTSSRATSTTSTRFPTDIQPWSVLLVNVGAVAIAVSVQRPAGPARGPAAPGAGCGTSKREPGRLRHRLALSGDHPHAGTAALADRRQPAQDLPQARRSRCRCCAASTWKSTRASSSASSAPPARGKSTLLHLLGTLDRPDEGTSTSTASASTTCRPRPRDQLRNQTFGFIFQFYHLLPELTTLENVLMPQMIAHSVFGWLRQRRELRRRAAELLDRVGLGHRLQPPAARTVRRRDAARRHRPGPDQSAAHPAGRRADRQPRRRHRRPRSSACSAT